MKVLPEAVLGLGLFLAFVTPAVLFLITEYRVLTRVQRPNRAMLPGLIWLQIIPVVGQIWQFVVVVYIARSIRQEAEARMVDSITDLLGPDLAVQLKRYPTTGLGIAYCVLITLAIFLNLFSTPGENFIQLTVPGIMSLAGIICWIIYWVRLAECSKILRRFSIASEPSRI
jgi:hypothetical protein